MAQLAVPISRPPAQLFNGRALPRPRAWCRSNSLLRTPLRRCVVPASSAPDGSGAPPPPSAPAFTNKLDQQNADRVKGMSDTALRARLRKMKQVDKLTSFIKVLEAYGKTDIADAAREVLADLAPPPPGFPSAGIPGPAAAPTPSSTPEEASERRAAAERRLQQKASNSVKLRLEALGMEVIMPGEDAEHFSWGVLAGYSEEKRELEDSVLLALANPEVYDEISRATKLGGAGAAGTNRPRGVLLVGPPGTGKTTAARVIAQRGSVPLVNVQFEKILSKWYGENERQLAEVLKVAEEFPQGCIVFLDELDSIMSCRDDGSIHEVTRRMLGILLLHLDGMNATRRTVFIGATNRKQDLDAALRSRFSTTVTFGLPDHISRVAILMQYAKHLGLSEHTTLARTTKGMSGRDLRAVCESAERRWASEIIRGHVEKGTLPSIISYLSVAEKQLRLMGRREEEVDN
ncbi:hypothetical protein D9Q98_008276 [Chlorella vulgaris]|uniref:AAA+ ATPase domain-containing protein n=1 Tax=Chlorella vulgaris TaxID=3077 RepID=A0A9D4TGE0_CHLVU|nr:hypothetical protein D9Q98_008276 [Chlorella vulgaris]